MLNGAHDKVCAPRDDLSGKLARDQLNFVLYDLRHTFATRAAEAGMDLAALAGILGHGSLRMVLKYIHIQQDHMDAEMDRLAREQPLGAPIRPQTTRNRSDFAGLAVNERELLN